MGSTPTRRLPVTATVQEQTVTIEGEWVITLPRAVAITYVRQYNAIRGKGFTVENGRVSFSHGMSRIFMGEDEAAAIVGQIRQAYGVT